MEEIWTKISGSGPDTGTDFNTFFKPAQPHEVCESVSMSCLPGTLPTRAARISEKSYLMSCSINGLQIVLFESYARRELRKSDLNLDPLPICQDCVEGALLLLRGSNGDFHTACVIFSQSKGIILAV